ncbi:hypothetical protein PF010_g6195 [Phytophthora fragariae]|uniref:Uncharacterized protein n=1 Tax=Phytophthora fragariae TaxID=53985 RepID=A0A6G0LL20_9STRA|nr:hypothetical protein PF010_g6195 [Phytophthora fragariae]KAE9250898.1 hypothetical protein PF004_g2734 [Phytophthora fragariae]
MRWKHGVWWSIFTAPCCVDTTLGMLNKMKMLGGYEWNPPPRYPPVRTGMYRCQSASPGGLFVGAGTHRYVPVCIGANLPPQEAYLCGPVPTGIYRLVSVPICLPRRLICVGRYPPVCACRYCGCEAGAGDAQFHVNAAIRSALGREILYPISAFAEP